MCSKEDTNPRRPPFALPIDLSLCLSLRSLLGHADVAYSAGLSTITEGLAINLTRN